MKPKGILNHQEANLITGIGNAMLFSVPLWLGIYFLFWLSSQSAPKPQPGTSVCKIIIPHAYLQSGWQIWDPAEDENVSNLKRGGKAEIVELPGQIECTLYAANQTPVTTPSALAMWRRIKS